MNVSAPPPSEASRTKGAATAAAFELFRELPPEIVSEKILSQFCDEKSLSTLALACVAAAAANDDDDDDDSSGSCYERIAYGIVPTIARERLLQQSLIIAGETKQVGRAEKKKNNNTKGSSKKKYEGIVKWIRMIAAVDNSVYTINTTSENEEEEEQEEEDTGDDEDDEGDQHVNIESLGQEFCETTKPLPVPNGKALAEQLRQTKQYRKLKAMRRLSENLAVAHFLRNSIEQSHNGHWEYTVWVGQLSVVTNIADAASLRKTVRTAITAPMPLKGPPPSCHNIIPGASLMHTHRTPTAHFRLEPYNLLRPMPPWGRVKGLAASDQALLQDLAATLDGTSGGSTICVPCPRYQRVHNDPLDVRILTQRQAQARIVGGANNRSVRTEWVVTDPPHAQNPLVCCWHDDSIDDESADGDDRAFVVYVICLLKAQERLLHQDH